jgi:hypothetical protein
MQRQSRILRHPPNEVWGCGLSQSLVRATWSVRSGLSFYGQVWSGHCPQSWPQLPSQCHIHVCMVPSRLRCDSARCKRGVIMPEKGICSNSPGCKQQQMLLRAQLHLTLNEIEGSIPGHHQGGQGPVSASKSTILRAQFQSVSRSARKPIARSLSIFFTVPVSAPKCGCPYPTAG